MKFVKAFILVLYSFVYAYACNRTVAEPTKIIWGYICTGIFAFLFISLVSMIVKNDDCKKNKENSNLEEIDNV